MKNLTEIEHIPLPNYLRAAKKSQAFKQDLLAGALFVLTVAILVAVAVALS